METEKTITKYISLRAIIVGIIFSFIIGAGDPYATLVIRGSFLAADYSTGAAIFLFFVLVFIINTILKLINRRFSLNSSELGGARVYSKSVPFFLGLVLGVFTTAGLWLIISALTKTPGIRLIAVG